MFKYNYSRLNTFNLKMETTILGGLNKMFDYFVGRLLRTHKKNYKCLIQMHADNGRIQKYNGSDFRLLYDV